MVVGEIVKAYDIVVLSEIVSIYGAAPARDSSGGASDVNPHPTSSRTCDVPY